MPPARLASASDQRRAAILAAEVCRRGSRRLPGGQYGPRRVLRPLPATEFMPMELKNNRVWRTFGSLPLFLSAKITFWPSGFKPTTARGGCPVDNMAPGASCVRRRGQRRFVWRTHHPAADFISAWQTEFGGRTPPIFTLRPLPATEFIPMELKNNRVWRTFGSLPLSLSAKTTFFPICSPGQSLALLARQCNSAWNFGLFFITMRKSEWMAHAQGRIEHEKRCIS